MVSGKILAGPLVRDAGQRHLDDLKDGPRRGLVWDWPAARRAIEFFPDNLKFFEGDHADKPFVLAPSQAFIVGSLFGWKGADGYRRFRIAYIEEGKGNGKSPLAAGIGLYMLTADGEKGAQCFAAATTRDQAKILFTDAVKMVDASDELTRRLVKSGDKDVHNLAYEATSSFFRPVSSEGKGLDGKRVHFAAIDEEHEHPNDVVYEKMRAGTKGRNQALILIITNSGVERTSICYQHHEYSGRVVNNLIRDNKADSWFAYVCALDAGDDPMKDPRCWPKANPLIGVSVTRKYIREQVNEATGMPAKESVVRRLNFCQWVDAANPWIDGYLWLACEQQFDRETLRGRRAWAGLDLSSKKDLTALGIAVEGDADVLNLIAEFWTPGDTIVKRSSEDKVPYSLWAEQGFIAAPPGKTIDMAAVAIRLGEIAEFFDLQCVAFDPWRIEDLLKELDALAIDAWIWEGPDKPRGDGIMLVRHSQGFSGGEAKHRLWMPRSVDAIEERVLTKRLRVLTNPVLRFNSAAAVLETDAKANRVFTKRKSTGRIDGIVAATMAVGAAAAAEAIPHSPYEERELRVF